MPNYNGVWSLSTQYQYADAWNLDNENPMRGLFFGNGEGAATNVIQFLDLATTGNAADFGDLTTITFNSSACGSSTRAVRGGGGTTGTGTATMDFVEIFTAGNATGFGNLDVTMYEGAGAGNNIKGIFAGGRDSGNTTLDRIEFITITSTGNGADFGNLTTAKRSLYSFSSPTRAFFLGESSQTTDIEFINISSQGNATDFNGDLTVATSLGGGCSSNTRGLSGGGFQSNGQSTNVISSITMSSLGNAVDFGDLTEIRHSLAGTSSPTRGIFFGGEGDGVNLGSGSVNTIDFVTIASQGNAADFGDALVVTRSASATSSAHGGI